MSNSHIIYCRTTTDRELQEILRLQQKNLYTHLSEDEQKQEGFVTVSHSLGLLKKMNEICPHIIAKAEERVVGYALCMHPRFSEEIELLKPMFQEIEKVLPKHTKYMVMGQICIDKIYRKKGVFKNLYKTMKEVLQPAFDSIITEVDAINTRSLNAHFGVGFEHLKTHISKGKSWELVVLKI